MTLSSLLGKKVHYNVQSVKISIIERSKFTNSEDISLNLRVGADVSQKPGV